MRTIVRAIASPSETLRFAARLYFRYLSLCLKTETQYRASYLMLTFTGFITSGMEFLGIWALFDRFHMIRGWTFAEVGLLYGMVNVAFALSEKCGRGFDLFHNYVKTGDFDRILLRPVPAVLQVLGIEMQILRLGRLMQGLIVLIWAALSLNLQWTAGKVAFTGLCILGGTSLFLGLLVLQATMSFWTIEGLEIMNVLTYGGIETAQYPLSIYRPWLRHFFTFVVPLACINYLPAMAILNRGDASLASYLSPALGFIFLAVSLQIWKIGILHYQSTGS